MIDENFLKSLGAKLVNALPENLHLLKSDFEKNVQSVLKTAFAKLELVTREEFDSQTKVLARTRQKVEALESELLILQQKLQELK